MTQLHTAKRLKHYWQTLPIRVRGTLIIAIPVACLFSALAAFAWLKASLVEDEIWVQHTQVVRLEAKRLLNALVDAETAVRGYGLTHRPEFLEPYDISQTVIPASLNRLEDLVSDNPQQSLRLQDIRTLTQKNLVIFQRKIALKQEASDRPEQSEVPITAASLYDWLDEGKATMNEVRWKIDAFAEAEEALLIKRIRHKDLYQQITWIALCIAGLVGTLGAAFAVHLFYQLERELVDRENNLRQTNQRLEVVCDQLQRFTANASHELRAPLAAVLSNAQVGLMDLEDWDSAPLPLRKKLTKIVDLTKRMSRLVSDLLFLARHEGLLASENLRRVELNGLVRGLADDWKLEAEAHQLKLDSQQPDTSIFVSADVNLLRQAIANLLSNACRYTPPGGTIHFNLMPSQNQQAIILVQDTGIGIPSEAIPHLFERFYRVDPKRSKASGGLGLGLAIAQQVIQAHRGQICVHSSVGEGTTFQITLPVATIDLQFDSASIDETTSLSPPVTLDAASTVGHSSSINRI